MRNGFPWVKLRGIEVNEKSSGKTQLLMNFNESVDALIDTTTPHLWLPPKVCDRFAAAFNLTWDEEREYYFLGESGSESTSLYNRYKRNTDIAFKFVLSDSDNNNLFDNERSVVNITAPIASFTSLLAYPFAGLGWSDPSLPYFTLKRSVKNESHIILGRTFMQEAYLKANYDPPRFSVHQAIFPVDPEDTDIETLDSGLFPLALMEEEENGLSTPALAGIVFAICAVLTAIIMTWYCRRRKKKAKQRREAEEMEAGADELKENRSEGEAHFYKIILKKLLARMKRPKPGEPRGLVSTPSKNGPAEVAADEDHERYELPAPTEPVELDAGTDQDSVNEMTELNTEDTRNLTAYEVARRKLDRQLQGPVPAYAPPMDGSMAIPPQDEKTGQNVALVGHYRPSNQPSPIETQVGGIMVAIVPSPLSPNPDWHLGQGIELPSPTTTAPPCPTIEDSYSPDSSSATASTPYPVSPNSNHPSSSLSRSDSQPSVKLAPLKSRHTQPLSFPSLIETPKQSHQPYLPSPMPPDSPHSASTFHSGQLPFSPISPVGGSVGTVHSPAQSIGPPIQRTPIDPARVVCLGPLPENVQLSGLQHASSLSSIPHVLGPDGRPLVSPTMHHTEANQSVETLGSNFTEEEEARLAEISGQNQQVLREISPVAVVSQPPVSPTVPPTAAQAMVTARSRRPVPPAIITGMTHLPPRLGSSEERIDTPKSPMRIDSGLDIVHVPQVAERRYSWEEDQ